MSELKRAAVTGVRWLGTASVFVVGVRFVQLAVLGRLLGPEAFGLMAMAMVFTGLATTLSEAGVPEFVVQQRDLTPDDVSSLYWFNVLVAAIVYGLLCLASPWIATAFGSPELAPIVYWVALSLVIASFATVHRGLCQKRLEFRRLASVEMAATLVTAAVSLGGAILAGLGVWSLVWGFLSGTVTQTLAFLWLGRRLGFVPRAVLHRESVRRYIGFGAFRVGSMALNFLRMRVDQLLIGFVLGAQPLGYYNMAISLVMQPVQKINPILNRVAFPVFSEIREDTPRLRDGYLRLVGTIATANAPLLLGAAAVAPLAVPLVFGGAWLPMVPLLQGLAVYALLRSVANAGGTLLLAKGRADWEFRWNVAVFLVTPLVVFGAARAGGVVAVAGSLAALQLPLTLLNYRFLTRGLVGPCFPQYARAAFVPFLTAGVMGLGVAALPGLLPEQPGAVVLAAQIGVGAIVYTVLAWLLQRERVAEVAALLRGSR